MAARAEHPAHRQQAGGQGTRGPTGPRLWRPLALVAWPPVCYPAGRQISLQGLRRPAGQQPGRAGICPPGPAAIKGANGPGPLPFYSAQRPGASGKRAQEWGQPTRTPAEYVQVAGGLPPDKRATLAWQLHATWGQGAICPERMRVMRPFEPLSHRFGCISLLGCAARAADDGRRALDSCRYPPGFDLRCWPW